MVIWFHYLWVMVKQKKIMMEGYGRAKLLTSWWPGNIGVKADRRPRSNYSPEVCRNLLPTARPPSTPPRNIIRPSLGVRTLLIQFPPKSPRVGNFKHESSEDI